MYIYCNLYIKNIKIWNPLYFTKSMNYCKCPDNVCVPKLKKKNNQIDLYSMQIGDLNPYTKGLPAKFNSGVNSLVVCYCDEWSAGQNTSCNVWMIKAKKTSSK
jgi:hypothetical protein